MCMVDDWNFMHYSQLVCKQPSKMAGIMDLDENLKKVINNGLMSVDTARDEYLGWVPADRNDIAAYLTKPNRDDIFHVKTEPCVNCGGPGHPKYRCEYCGT